MTFIGRYLQSSKHQGHQGVINYSKVIQQIFQSEEYFKEIVLIYETFIHYKQGTLSQNNQSIKKHQFMLTKSIEQLKLNLENYQTNNPQHFNKLITQIEQSDQTFKTSYLKGLLNAQENKPISSADNMHRYFDKSLGNLFQQKIQSQIQTNKINHCILSLAYGNLEMGEIDQCLQSISQGLRISQNNSDEQSINNCIIYLYKIAQQLGKFREQILLAQHAITHSLNLNNLTLMLYSCLSYSYFEKNHDCQDPALMILKSRNISWTEALHFAKKKIYSSFQNTCKNIYHNHRNLLIPTFIHKLAILIHLPTLTPLLLNPYYDRPQLTNLQIHKYYNHDDKLHHLIRRANRYFNLGQTYLFSKAQAQIQKLRDLSKSPMDIITIDSFNNQIKFEKKQYMDAYKSIQKLLEYCQKNGFMKKEYLNQLNLINQILLSNHMYYDALVKIQQTCRIAVKYQLKQEANFDLVLKAQAYLQLDILRNLEQSGKIYDASLVLKRQFYKAKRKLNATISKSIDMQQFPDEHTTLLQNQLDCLQRILQINIQQLNLSRVHTTIKQISTFINKHHMFSYKLDVVKKTQTYLQKIIKIYSETQYETSDDGLIIKKVQMKLNQIYFKN